MFRCENQKCKKICKISESHFHCENCGDKYCSQYCLDKSKNIHICKATYENDVSDMLSQLGYGDVKNVAVLKIFGEGYFPLPGPISGPDHPKMIPKDIYLNLLDEQGRDRFSNTDIYYIILDKFMTKLFLYELTDSQKSEMQFLISKKT
jgi:hypothetical protein